MSDEPPADREPPYEEIDASRSHVLGIGDAGYGVWARGGSDEPTAVFPNNDEGFADAEAEFNRLTRADRASRGSAITRLADSPRLLATLVWIVAGGLGVWVVVGTAFNVLYWWRVAVSESPTEPGLLFLAQAIESIAFRVWLAALALLAVAWLTRHLRKA